MSDIQGPFIVWEDYGCEGWQPKSYPTMREALCVQKTYNFVITKIAEFNVIERQVRKRAPAGTFDRKSYQRELMRKRRAAERAK